MRPFCIFERSWGRARLALRLSHLEKYPFRAACKMPNPFFDHPF